MWLADLCLSAIWNRFQPPGWLFLAGFSECHIMALGSHIAPYQVLYLLIMFPTRTHCSGSWQPPPVSAVLTFLAQVSRQWGGQCCRRAAMVFSSLLSTDSAGSCLLGAGVPDVSPRRCVDQSWDRSSLWPGSALRSALRGHSRPLRSPAVQGKSWGPSCC